MCSGCVLTLSSSLITTNFYLPGPACSQSSQDHAGSSWRDRLSLSRGGVQIWVQRNTEHIPQIQQRGRGQGTLS